MIEPQRRRRIDDGVDDGSFIDFVVAKPMSKSQYLECIPVALSPKTVRVGWLVAQRDDVTQRMQMTNRRVDIGRFDWVPTVHLNSAQMLTELDQVDEVPMVASPTAASDIARVRWACDCSEDDIVPADLLTVVGVARM